MEPFVWDGRQAVRQARRLRRLAAELGDRGEELEWDLVQVAILALAAKRTPAPTAAMPADRSSEAVGNPPVVPKPSRTEPEQTSPG